MSLYKSIRKVNNDITQQFEVQRVILHNDEPLILEGKIASVDHNKALANAHDALFGKQRKQRDEDRLVKVVSQLYPVHVFTGWNVVDEKGKKVKYSPKQCGEILSDLDPNDIADIVFFFTEPSNFDEVVTKQDGEVLGNESGK